VRLPSIVALLLVLQAGPAEGQDRVLYVRPWCELQPFATVGSDEYPLSKQTAAARVLEEGRVLFSAMVYGYTFLYTPSDAARKVAERFELVPVAEIPWGAVGVSVMETMEEDGRLYARLSYVLSGSELKRRESWESSAVAKSAGSGEGSLFKGYRDKITALDNAIKNAIREYLRTRILNKPREIRGEVILWEDPRTIVRAGVYVTTAAVKLRVTEIVPYRIFG
jgi:hypothetical protein